MRTPEAMPRSADGAAHFAWSGVRSAGGVMHSADDVNPPLEGGFLQ